MIKMDGVLGLVRCLTLCLDGIKMCVEPKSEGGENVEEGKEGSSLR